jgi:hypothetical protein
VLTVDFMRYFIAKSLACFFTNDFYCAESRHTRAKEYDLLKSPEILLCHVKKSEIEIELKSALVLLKLHLLLFSLIVQINNPTSCLFFTHIFFAMGRAFTYFNITTDSFFSISTIFFLILKHSRKNVYKVKLLGGFLLWIVSLRS